MSTMRRKSSVGNGEPLSPSFGRRRSRDWTGDGESRPTSPGSPGGGGSFGGRRRSRDATGEAESPAMCKTSTEGRRASIRGLPLEILDLDAWGASNAETADKLNEKDEKKWQKQLKRHPVLGGERAIRPELNQCIFIVKMDATRLKVQSLVCPLEMDSRKAEGVIAEIHDVAGAGLSRELAKASACEAGQVVVTDGHNLLAQSLMHAIPPRNAMRGTELFRSCYTKAFELAEASRLRSIAFVELNYCFDELQAAHIAFDTCREWLESLYKKNGGLPPPERVVFCLSGEEEWQLFLRLAPHYFPRGEVHREEDEDQMMRLTRAVMSAEIGKQAAAPKTPVQNGKSPAAARRGSVGRGAENVKDIFKEWDKDGNGKISRKEMSVVFARLCPKMSPDDMNRLFKAMDKDKSGAVDYEEFVAFLYQ
eukprot:TRINITY_DN18917_c0_g1_i1.p1 TRINITY_DN18917_c0_g1~~TRINITY_DN18917_c0_g1_i1.p1  ORF type:complete len:422 (-),score=101.97 TRINITY_DN18917_c0_g1_i1:112-1377(-)